MVVVKRDAEGEIEIQKATDHSTKRGMTWGLVGGAALGILFPPSLLGSAAVLGAGGAALGKAHQLHHKIDLAKELSYSDRPGPLGIVALVSDPERSQIREALAKANGIVESAVDDVVAKDIRALRTRSRRGDRRHPSGQEHPVITTIPDMPAGTIGFEATGTVTAEDYETVLVPALTAAIEAGPVRLLYVLGDDFESYSPGRCGPTPGLGGSSD